jgi:hypothetical protein
MVATRQILVAGFGNVLYIEVASKSNAAVRTPQRMLVRGRPIQDSQMSTAGKLLTEMFLRAYAQSSPRGKPFDAVKVREQAVYKVTVTLTAPVIALSCIFWSQLSRTLPNVFAKTSWQSLTWFVLSAAVCGGIYILLWRKFGDFNVPNSAVEAHRTWSQRAILLVELLFGIGCIVAIGVVAIALDHQ